MRFSYIYILPFLLLISACDEAPTPKTDKQQIVRPAKIAVARNQLIDVNRTFPGVTEAAKRTDLAFRVNGQIIELPVRASQILKKGDLIARLDEAAYRNSFNDRRAKFELARNQYQRQQKLFKQKHISKSRLDEARSSYQAAEAAYKLAQDDLSYTKLLAPYDGIVSRVDVDNFQNIQAKERIAVFQGAEEINIVFNVPESLFVRLNKDNTNEGHVIVQFDSLPDLKFDAWYQEHDTLPDQLTRSYKVTVSMPLPTDITVLPGMSVSVSVNLSALLQQQAQGVLVPLEAVFNQDNKNWVWRLNDQNMAQKTKVEIGGLEQENIRILQGLSENDRVIAVGVTYVREGQKVKPMTKERGL